MKSANGALASSTNIIRLPFLQKQSQSDELEFLPAALEVVETPPPLLGRVLGGIIAALFSVALVWATFSKIDIIATAPGKIVPSGRVKLIQPFETGVVRAIRVRDGEWVKAGEVVIELDPTVTDAEEGHIRSDLISAELDVARLTAALSDGDNAGAAFAPPENVSPELVDMQRKYLAHQTDEYRAKLASLDGQRVQKEAERSTVLASIKKLQESIPLVQERAEILKGLADRQLASRLTYLETAQQLAEGQGELYVQNSKLDEATAAVAALASTRAEAVAEYNRKTFADLEEAKRKVAGLSQDLAKAEQRTKLQELTAPVDGVVQQLSVHTVGGVVKPAEQLAVIVPSDTTLEVDAMVSNRDIGFVHQGQAAQIKVDAFNFTRYGMLRGKVISLSSDAIVQDLAQGGIRKPTEDAEGPAEAKNQELNYDARIALDQTQIEVDNTLAKLGPGMTVSVEIKTGSRSVISYLLSPLTRSSHESLHER
jgi:hemolysin D